MLKIEKTVLPSPEQWEIIIEGMRNPMNSWDKMDSETIYFGQGDSKLVIGEADHKLMASLAKGGAVHAKYRRMIPVFLTINAPLYWWKEMSTYSVGVVVNSCSTMHKIHSKELTMDDFSMDDFYIDDEGIYLEDCFNNVVIDCELLRKKFLETGDKKYWKGLIQLLPTSYNQKRTVMLNYEVLVNIYHSRKNHKLDEWITFCDWIKGLPYAELITGEEGERREGNEDNT